VDCVTVAATDPLYILYTSGTTGLPKGVVRDNGGHMVALKWSMKNIYGIEPGEVYWSASDVGWVVGHSYIVYAPLLHGATTICYEGKPVGTPDAGAFWRVIAEHKVAALFTAPTAFRAIKKEDPNGEFVARYDLSHFRTLFLAGERADPDTIQWAERILGVPVIDHWWQTETGWAIAANPVGLGAAAGQVRLAHRRHAGLRRARAGRGLPRGAAGHARRHLHQAAACRRAACRPCGTPTSASGRAISRPIPAIIRRRTPATATRTAISTSWPAPTTSSTWPATACRPGPWRKRCRGTRTSPNAP
jgi:acyl-coenzyme A synthetase/AMP-(fatty) acid ligase